MTSAIYTPALDPRLTMIADLYDSCRIAADIGTDHARLPAALLQCGRCQHMILTDISPDALENARREIERRALTDRAELRLGDGLSPLLEQCGMISITGMGGKSIRSILIGGREKLCGASLILSAHTDLHLIRQSVADIGYHLDREEPCLSGGRFYLVFRARPGMVPITDREIRLGSVLFDSHSPSLVPYLKRRRQILSVQLAGIRSAIHPDEKLISLLLSDLLYLGNMIDLISDREGSE